MTTENQAVTHEDPVEEFLAGLKSQEESDDDSQDAGQEQSEESAETAPADDEAGSGGSEEGSQSEGSSEGAQEKEIDIDALDDGKKLALFNKITGLNVSSVDEARKYTNVFNEYPTLQKRMELYPTLVEKLKKSQDVMSYFPDEVAYKVAQLAKDEKYKGKEGDISRLLRSDVKSMNSMDVVRLYASITAPDGIKNPFRYTIKKMGLDPDEVTENFDSLSEDDQDAFAGLASQARKELGEIGRGIEVPQSTTDDIESLLEQATNSAKDEVAKIKSQIEPITMDLVSQVNELPVLDDFNFKLHLTDDEKKEYSEFLTQAIVTGEFNVSTDEGKKELYEALLDEIRIDNYSKIIKAVESHTRTLVEKEYREKYNNEKPLDKKSPAPGKAPEKKTIVNVVEDMINDVL